MLFNSVYFFIFFPSVTLLFFLLPGKYRWMLLLAASCYFYAAFIPKYILILFFLIIVDYFSGLVMEKASDKKRKFFLLFSLFSNLGVLFIFKYFNFFNYNIYQIANFFHWNYSIDSLKLALPVGLSFHTFQSMSYIIEVYKKKIKAEKHIGRYALYVMFFPQLVAGPIERPQNLLPQLHLENIRFSSGRTISGLRLMLWGFIKKMIIADNCALVVNHVFAYLYIVPSQALLISIILFSFQIYCDFSGYSDIARGSARLLGINLMKNFNLPFFSKSIAEFWRRWHISLSTWFQDYLFNPLYYYVSRSRHINKIDNLKVKHLFCFTLTMLVGESLLGLWHGANWTFIFFGLYHGFFIVAYYLIRKIWDKWPMIIQTIFTFFITTFGWIFFRAGSLSDALYIIRNIFVGLDKFFDYNFLRYSLFVEGSVGVDKFFMIKIIAFIFSLFCVELLSYNWSITNFFDKRPRYIRWSLYYILIMMIFFFGYFGSLPFIYFQF